MMKPEPSERLSGRAPPGPGGCWRGMKRRKNSSTSSSSMPGTCGAAPLRRTACVVLMLTTALPWSSTRRVKSGSSRTACANAMVENRTSQAAVTALAAFMFLFSRESLLLLLRPAVFHRVGDALHAGRRCLAHHGHHVVRDLARVDVDRAHAGEPGAHRVAASIERLDEHRYRREAVRVH